MASQKRRLGVIGGSGLYQAPGFSVAETRAFETPWGRPSGPLVFGACDGVETVFLSRHGPGHALTPDEVNYRANIDALKQAGVTDIISFSACGSFREELAPGAFLIMDQYIDRTAGRASTFFGRGFVAHVSMADPVCAALSEALAAACADCDIVHQRGGTYLAINGPQFSTRAESHLYRSRGCDVIGMTNMPEAKLAREAELPYASVGMVTDYDCWREDEDAVDVAGVLAVMAKNTENAGRVIQAVCEILGPMRDPSPQGIETCLDFAVITAPEARDPALCEKLKTIAGRYFDAQTG